MFLHLLNLSEFNYCVLCGIGFSFCLKLNPIIFLIKYNTRRVDNYNGSFEKIRQKINLSFLRDNQLESGCLKGEIIKFQSRIICLY